MVVFFSSIFFLELTAGEYTIKLSVLKLCLRDDIKTNTFGIRLVDNSCLPFSSILTPHII